MKIRKLLKMYQTSSFDSKFPGNNLQRYPAVKLTLRDNIFCIHTAYLLKLSDE